jgi:acyl carrier protein
MQSKQLRSGPAVERRVAEIWRDVLEMPVEKVNATFFELNGQSISAVRIVTRIEEELNILVDVGDLFDDPDLATFVRNVAAKAAESGRPTPR